METILFLGDYYPLFTYQSKMNQLIAENLRKKGYQLILLSRAWSEVTEDTFYGTVETLSSNYPFHKKYFVDPIQLKMSDAGVFNGYLALLCEILKKEEIDKVIFADEPAYLPIMEMMKNRYQVPCYFLCFNSQGIKYLLDDYEYSYMAVNLSVFDKIYTYPKYCAIFQQIFGIHEENVVSSYPLECLPSGLINDVKCKSLYLLCDDYSDENLEKTLSKLELMFDLSKIAVRVIWSNVEDLEEVYHNGVCYKKCLANDIPKDSMVIYEKELYNSKMLNIGYLLTCIKCGMIPLVREEYRKELEDLSAKYLNVDKFCAVKRIEVQDSDVWSTTF